MIKIVDEKTTKEEKIAIIKTWIIDNLKVADRDNLDYQLGVVHGFERVLKYIYNYNTPDEDILKAYVLFKKRTGFKKNVFKQRW